jgi:Flp pilus assembly protein TadD
MLINIFFCYAHEDEPLLNKLKSHLRPLQRQGLIDVWRDRDISAGSEWEQEINQHLNSAQIILLLVSPDFMDSDYCYSIEMKRAIERHERGEALVIPVILRHVYWQGAPFGRLQALPKDGKPVMSAHWHNLDEAFLNIVEGISGVLPLVKKKIVKQDLVKAKELYKKGLYDAALNLYEQIINLVPNQADAYAGKGESLWYLNRYEEALSAYDQAISLEPDDADLYGWKAEILVALNKYEEALVAFEQAIRSSPVSDEEGIAKFYEDKGYLLEQLKRPEEALNAYDIASQFRGRPRPSSQIARPNLE